jgi:hypothetical protein
LNRKLPFDITRHEPPRVDIAGMNLLPRRRAAKGRNILAKNVRIPEWWQSQTQTRAALLENRRQQLIP